MKLPRADMLAADSSIKELLEKQIHQAFSEEFQSFMVAHGC